MYIIGEPIVAQITYCNNNLTQDWKLARPDSNSYCEISYIRGFDKQMDGFRSFNGFISGVYDLENILYPFKCDTIMLKPHEKYTFNVDIMLKMGMSSLMPGKIVVCYEDKKQVISVQTDSACVVFSAKSIPLLIALMQNPQCQWETIVWSRVFLQLIYREFQYKYTEIHTDTTIHYPGGYYEVKPDTTIYHFEDNYRVKYDYNKEGLVYYTPAQKEANDQNIQAFMQYWEQHQNDPEVIKLIKDINWNPVKYRIGYMDDYCKWRNNDCNE
jgi:hypothetical protein